MYILQKYSYSNSVSIPYHCPIPCPCPCLCPCVCPLSVSLSCPCLSKYGAMNIFVRHGYCIVDSQGLQEVAWKLKGPLTLESMGKVS
jgi:hypothetical protein